MPYIVFHLKVVFCNIFPYYSFDTNMDPTGCSNAQQQIKIIEAYFATKSVFLTQRQCRNNFGRNNVPDGRTMQHLVAKFRKTGSVADAHKGRYRSFLSIIPENIQNLWECHEESPRKSTCCLSKEIGFSRKLLLRILHDDLKLFLYKIHILQRQTDQNKAEREAFCKMSFKGLKMTLACWI